MSQIFFELCEYRVDLCNNEFTYANKAYIRIENFIIYKLISIVNISTT